MALHFPTGVTLSIGGTLARSGNSFVLLMEDQDRHGHPTTRLFPLTVDEAEVAAQIAPLIGQEVIVEGRWQPDADDHTGTGSLVITAVKRRGEDA